MEGNGSTRSLLLSFYPHPLTVLRGEQIEKLSPLRQLLELLGEQRVATVGMIRFTRAFSRLSAREFIERFLIDHLGVSHLVIGADTSIGAGREAGPEQILELLERCGISGEIVPLVAPQGRKVGSGNDSPAVARRAS